MYRANEAQDRLGAIPQRMVDVPMCASYAHATPYSDSDFHFEKVNFTLSAWRDIIEQFEDRTIFQTPAWLSFLAETQQAEPVFAMLRSGKDVCGYFSGLIVRKFGLKILGSPLPGWTTSYMGLNLMPGVPRRLVVDALMRFAFEELHCLHVEMMDRHLTMEDGKALGYEYTSLQGFEVDLSQTEEQVFSNMTSACRRCIRRADKSGMTIEEAHDMGFADEYYEQLQEVFKKRSLVPTYGRDRVKALIRCVADPDHLLLVRARDSEGRCIATGIFPALNGTMYFWGGASRQASLGDRPNEAIHWYAMRYWKRRSMRRYDMGGGGEYKRKYGGQEIAVPWLRKSKYPWLRPLRGLAAQAIHWSQAIRGKTARFNGGLPEPPHPATHLIEPSS
jgi:hypothetical protein